MRMIVNLSVAVGILLMMVVINNSFLQDLFGITPRDKLTILIYGVCISAGLLAAAEILSGIFFIADQAFSPVFTKRYTVSGKIHRPAHKERDTQWVNQPNGRSRQKTTGRDIPASYKVCLDDDDGSLGYHDVDAQEYYDCEEGDEVTVVQSYGRFSGERHVWGVRR